MSTNLFNIINILIIVFYIRNFLVLRRLKRELEGDLEVVKKLNAGVSEMLDHNNVVLSDIDFKELVDKKVIQKGPIKISVR